MSPAAGAPAPNVLVLSLNFPPDLSAGSFRVGSLAEALAEAGPVTVLTGMPSRYASHSTALAPPAHEQCGHLIVRRLPVGRHGGGMISQSLLFLRFAARALPAALRTDCDVVYATTSRLMTGFLGAVIATLKRKPLYLDVRDIFFESMQDILPGRSFALLRPAIGLIERWTIRRADRINLVSPGFVSYFEQRLPGQGFDVLTNGVDEAFIDQWQSLPVPEPAATPRELIIAYAGNMGEGQGLEHVLPAAATQLGGIARFVLYGDGGRKDALRAALAEAGVNNVTLHDPIAREDLLRVFCQADALFVHLNDYAAFLRVLPSKLFEYGATGKPVIAGVGGVAAAFVARELPHAQLIEPKDVAGLVAAVTRLRDGAALSATNDVRDRFVARHRRTQISRQLAEAIRALAA